MADGRAVVGNYTAFADWRAGQGARRCPRGDQRDRACAEIGGRRIKAPPDYGPRIARYDRYACWATKGVWIDLFLTLAQAGAPP